MPSQLNGCPVTQSILISQPYTHGGEAKESAIRLLDVLNQPKIEAQPGPRAARRAGSSPVPGTKRFVVTAGPSCECQLRCAHHPDGKCPRYRTGDDNVCDECRRARFQHDADKARGITT